MANNIVQVKRTTVSGRQPNTTGSYVTNSQYIAAGELALNMADGILYSSNGSAVIEIGANNTNAQITGNLTVKAIIANGSIGTGGDVLASNGSAVYWTTVGGTGTVTSVGSANGIAGGPITSTGTLYAVAGNSTVFVNASGIHVNTASLPGGGTNVDAQYTWTNLHTFSANVTLAGVIANGSIGSANQVLTTNGTVTYWGDIPSGGSYMKGGSTTVGSLAVEGQNIFRVNSNTMSFDATIVTGENAQATGPLTVASGKTLTIQSGARVSIV